MNKAESRFYNTIQLANCEGCMLNIIEKGNARTLGRIMEFNHNLDEKFYEFTLANGDYVTLEELSVYVVDSDRDNRVAINVYIKDDYKIDCMVYNIYADDSQVHYYSIERAYEKENRIWNTIQLANCEGSMLNIIEKGNARTLGEIMGYKHTLDAKYYEFTLTNGDCVMLEERSVHVADYDIDEPVVINIYIDDDYEVGCFTNDILAEDRNFQYYSIERVYENIPDID